MAKSPRWRLIHARLFCLKDKCAFPEGRSDLPSLEGTGVNRRILVVDDQASIHEDFQKILGSAGSSGLADLDPLELEILELGPDEEADLLYHLDFASSGRQALDMLIQAQERRQPYALAFVDMRMPPGWDGLETVERMWQRDPLLQVVICTAYSDYSWDDLQRRVRSADNLLLLSKPFDVMEIRQAAASMTLRRHLTESAMAQLGTLQEELEHSREELERLNRRLLAILDAAPVGIVTTDQDLRIRGLNHRARQMLGLHPEAAAGRLLDGFLAGLPETPGDTALGLALNSNGNSFPVRLQRTPLQLEPEAIEVVTLQDRVADPLLTALLQWLRQHPHDSNPLVRIVESLQPPDLPASPSRFCLNELARGVMSRLQVGSRKGLRWELNLHSPMPAIEADRDQLEGLLLQLGLGSLAWGESERIVLSTGLASSPLGRSGTFAWVAFSPLPGELTAPDELVFEKETGRLHIPLRHLGD